VMWYCLCFFFFQAEDGIRDFHVTGVQTCALPISAHRGISRGTRALWTVTDEIPCTRLRSRSSRPAAGSRASPQTVSHLRKDPMTSSSSPSQDTQRLAHSHPEGLRADALMEEDVAWSFEIDGERD